MSTQATIQDKLSNAIKASNLEVINESSQHNVPPGSESHFKLVIVSDDFEGKSLITRHRLVNEILADELSNKIHALTIHAYTVSEWDEKNKTAPASPPCLGGSK